MFSRGFGVLGFWGFGAWRARWCGMPRGPCVHKGVVCGFGWPLGKVECAFTPTYDRRSLAPVDGVGSSCWCCDPAFMLQSGSRSGVRGSPEQRQVQACAGARITLPVCHDSCDCTQYPEVSWAPYRPLARGVKSCIVLQICTMHRALRGRFRSGAGDLCRQLVRVSLLLPLHRPSPWTTIG